MSLPMLNLDEMRFHAGNETQHTDLGGTLANRMSVSGAQEIGSPVSVGGGRELEPSMSI
jgi:hypothetical protein